MSEPKPGEIWIAAPNGNPWQKRDRVRIVAVRVGWVRYEYLPRVLWPPHYGELPFHAFIMIYERVRSTGPSVVSIRASALSARLKGGHR